MEIQVIAGDVTSQTVDAVLVSVFESAVNLEGPTEVLDRALDGAISDLMRDGEIKGARGEISLIHTLGKIAPKRVIVVGLGSQQTFNIDTLRYVGGESARFLKKLRVGECLSAIQGPLDGRFTVGQESQAVVEGVLLGLYKFTEHKSDKPSEDAKIRGFGFIHPDQSKVAEIEHGVSTGRVMAGAARMARDMVNQPANWMTPTKMAEISDQLARDHGVDLTIFDKQECEEMGMGAYLGVAKGSEEEPKFIVLSYKGDPGNPANNVGIIGKGITFDSGGISLKPAPGMAAMKGDMAGGAAAIASMKAIAQLKPAINVTVIVAATENLPSGTATKPGDVLYAMNGKTIEVDNTDAEGRVTLADAVLYAKNIGLQRLVDIATLTGAIRTSLGNVRMGLFANNQSWADEVLRAGDDTGERMWQLPMDDDYKELNRSNVADIKNTGGPSAGSITAAHFIGEFAESTPWVHLDIAAVSMFDKEKGIYVNGATGIPVRSLVRLVMNLANNQ
ncbi:MAG: leucyl aminopeptidase [SAR202 cluster bacterium]|nr:leucyl aminopeptidase [SAR202 cluster bacterium]